MQAPSNSIDGTLTNWIVSQMIKLVRETLNANPKYLFLSRIYLMRLVKCSTTTAINKLITGLAYALMCERVVSETKPEANINKA